MHQPLQRLSTATFYNTHTNPAPKEPKKKIKNSKTQEGDSQRGNGTKDSQQIFSSLKFSLRLNEQVVTGKNLLHFFLQIHVCYFMHHHYVDEFLFCLLLCSGKQLFYMLLFCFHHSMGRTKPYVTIHILFLGHPPLTSHHELRPI